MVVSFWRYAPIQGVKDFEFEGEIVEEFAEFFGAAARCFLTLGRLSLSPPLLNRNSLRFFDLLELAEQRVTFDVDIEVWH